MHIAFYPYICAVIAVITGDIIDSRQVKAPERWLTPLKEVLDNAQGCRWELYRGDSFQVELPDPAEALHLALLIKATIKAVKPLDVRMAIGIGEKTYTGSSISESSGPAFVHSGQVFDGLRKMKQNLAIKTPWGAFDEEMNLYFKLALIGLDNWTPAAAAQVRFSLLQPELNQQQMAKKLGIAQSSVSERQKRAHLAELVEMDAFFRKKITQQLHR